MSCQTNNNNNGKEHHEHKDGSFRSPSATLEKMKLEMRRRSHTFQAFSKSSRSISDKQERDAMIAHKNDMAAQTYINYDDITLYCRIMKPALMFIDDIFDIFQDKKLNPHESEKILNFLVEELRNAQSEGGLLVASRITEHLLSEKNPFRGIHMKDFLAFTTGVKAVLQRLKKSRTPNSTVLLYLLNIVYYVAQDGIQVDGKIMLYKEGALDKVILLLYREKEDVLEYMQVKILVTFYKEDFYRRAIDIKSEATTLERLRNDEDSRSQDVKRFAQPLRKQDQKDSGVPHQMVKVHFNKPTFCKYCTEFIWGLGKQGYACSVCGYSSHKRCHDKIPATCIPSSPLLDSRRSTLRQLGLRNSIDKLASSDSLRDSRDYELNLHGKLIKWACTGKIPIHNEIQQNDISLEKCIYQSPLCEVYKASFVNKPATADSSIVAVKRFDPNSIAFTWEDFRKEISLLTVVTNSKVVKFLGASTKSDHPYILFEFFNRGSLKAVFEDFRKRNFKPSIYFITLLAIDMCTAMEFLHKRNIIHRDIKPANFLVGDHYEIKVTDFGASRVISPDLKMTKVGTPVWMAPEIQRNEIYTEKADVYSFSLVLYELVTLQPPFHNISHLELYAHVVLKKERPPIPADCPNEMAQLIKSCWHDDPSQRPSFATILDTLYTIMDPSTGERVMDYHARVAAVVLAQLCAYLELTDLYSCSQVSRSWYVVIAQALPAFGVRVTAPKMPAMQEWQRNLNLSRSPQMTIIGTSRRREGGSNDNSKSSSENNSSSEYPIATATEPSKPEEIKALRMKHVTQAFSNSTEDEKSRMLSSALGNAFKNMKKQRQTLSKKALDKQLQDLKIMLDTQKLLAEEAAKFKKKLLSKKSKSTLQNSDDVNAFFIPEEDH